MRSAYPSTRRADFSRIALGLEEAVEDPALVEDRGFGGIDILAERIVLAEFPCTEADHPPRGREDGNIARPRNRS